MRIRLAITAGITFLVAGSGVYAAELEAKGSLTCAIMEARECTATGPCVEVTPQDINIRSPFFDIEFGKGVLRSHNEEQPGTEFKVATKEGDRIILTGSDSGTVDENGVGYSMSISKTSGDMVLSVAGSGAAFSLFGACTNN